MRPTSRKITRIFVARIPPSVTDELFRSYFEKYGTMIDAYMPKDQATKQHRGIGFVTYENADSVDKLMSENHELGGSTIAVDRATPKEESGKFGERAFPGAYGAIDNYVSAPRFGAFGMSPFGGCDFAGSDPGVTGAGNNYGSNYGASNMWPAGPPPPQAGHVEGPLFGMEGIDPSVNKYGSAAPLAALPRMGKKIFVGRVPVEATTEDLRLYFSQFGKIVDVYLPKDAKKISHRGFGFVTFAEESSTERVALKRHEILGHQIAVDRASPLDETPSGGYYGNASTSSNSLSGGSGLGGSSQAMPGIIGNDYGSAHLPEAPPRLGKKIFIGRIPVEATTEDLRLYFSQYGRVSDVYLPKDAKKISHRGFGFVTFSEESTAERVAQRTHEILGHLIAVDRAAPLDEPPSKVDPSNSLFGGAGGPLRASSSTIPGSSYGNVPGDHDYNSGWAPYGILGPMASADGGTSGHRVSRMEPRYRPY
eukprot:Gb_27963 [translate_table: standard]